MSVITRKIVDPIWEYMESHGVPIDFCDLYVYKAANIKYIQPSKEGKSRLPLPTF